MEVSRASVVLFLIGLVLIIAGFQGKLGAIIASVLSPGDVETGSGGGGSGWGGT